MKTIYHYLCAWALLAGVTAACTDEDYKVYDTTQKDSAFFNYINEEEEPDTIIKYAFNFDIATVHTLEIPVTLMGMPVDRDRAINIVPVAAESDMVEGTHYTLENLVLPAGEVTTNIKVNLLRENDPAIRERVFKLKLEIVENEDLRSVGQRFFRIEYSDIRPDERPEWWSTDSYSAMPVYSFETAQLFFQYFYENAPKANREVFDEMIERYGDYFVKAVALQGPMAMYTNFMKRYVLIPLYEDTKGTLEWYAVPSL